MFLCVILELVSVLQFVLEFAFFHLIFDFFVSAVFFVLILSSLRE